MDQILQGMKSTIYYLDDILLSGANEIEYIYNLKVVLQRLHSRGIKVHLDKVYLCNKVYIEYLGHRIDVIGLHPTSNKIKAIVDAPEPTTLSELKSYLGLLNYCGRIMPNLFTMLQPLN